MASQKLSHILGTFDHSAMRWVPVPRRVLLQRPLQSSAGTTFSLVSWNIDAFSPRPAARARAILDHLLSSPSARSDIIFLQEVTLAVRDNLLQDMRIRNGFFTTDTEDTTSFSDVPFATMTLLSKRLFTCCNTTKDDHIGSVTRFKLPSRFGRDVLCTDVFLPFDTASTDSRPSRLLSEHSGLQRLRLLNLHLDSLWPNFHYRKSQMAIVASVMHDTNVEQGESYETIGLAAGDFNAVRLEDQALIEENGLSDPWLQLYGSTTECSGASSEAATSIYQPTSRSGRLDRVALTKGFEPLDMHFLRPGKIELPKPGEEKSSEVRWSDHPGLKCSLRVR